MDHLLMLTVAGAAFGAWVHALRRDRTPMVWKVAAIPGLITVAAYFAVEALRTRGVWISGEAQAGWPAILAMGAAFTAATGGFDERPRAKAKCA